MSNAPIIETEILDKDISSESLLEYISLLDPKRREVTDTVNMDMLIGLLRVANYRTIRDLHKIVKIAWMKFQAYERDKVQSSRPLSGTLTILFVAMLADEDFRKKVATTTDLEELSEYLV